MRDRASESLERINHSDAATAERMLLDCCGSTRWASLMAARRPFASETELIDFADIIWNSLRTSDWLEAFSAHPKIGETKAATTQQVRSAEWSRGEQAGLSSADEQLKSELSDVNREYYEKFGFIFIVCATGKSAREMLDLCRQRLANDRETEIGNAADEQKKITEIRLRKLLSL